MVKRSRVPISEETVERAHELVESGLSARAAAREVGVEYSSLYPRLKKRGTRMRTQSASASHRNREQAFRQRAADQAVEQIVSAFKETPSSLDVIADRFGTDRINVRRLLKDAGITQDEISIRQRNQTGLKSTIEARKGVNLEMVATEYLAGASLVSLAAKYGVHYVTLSARLSDLGIEIRDNRKWQFRQDAFTTLTPEGAYWLGFIEADGNIGRDKPTLTIRLQERDLIVLEQFADWLELARENITHRVHRNGFGECLLHVTSQTIHDDLVSYGIVPRKSWNWSGGFNIPNELLGHFVRGWFDGDGVAGFNMGKAANGAMSVLGFSGLSDSLAWLRDKLSDVMPIDSLHLRNPRPGAPHFAVLDITQKAAIAAFYEFANGFPRLERKWAKIDIHYEQWQTFGNKNWKADPEIAARIRALK